MVRVKNPEVLRNQIMNHPIEDRRIFSIAAHIDHGKSTASDYLLRRAGLMSDEDAGLKVATDSDDEEQERGITIFTSVVNLSYEYKGKEYLFGLSDTPGHISFTGEVSRALRGSDGALILVDALEGMMTQTETNIRLSVGEERCKPVLFINKVDRLISELKLPPSKVFERLDTIVALVNAEIKKHAPKEFRKEWQVSFQANSVAAGSAKDGWAFTLDILKEKEYTPTVVFEHYAADDRAWLRDNLQLDDALLRMIIEHLPSPDVAQKYKIPHIWKGDLESEAGQSLMNCDRNGPLLGMITKIFIDPKSKRPTLIGRIFSGTLRNSDSIYLLGRKENIRIRRLGVMEITDILDVPEIPAGTLFAVYGFICPSGESFVRSGEEIKGFEEIQYAAEPVVSQTIHPKSPQDLAKLGEVVGQWVMADGTATFRQDPESKRYVLSGIDPLQIEILVSRINEQIPIDVSDPVIVHREFIDRPGENIHAKSPNGHNRIILRIEPLEEGISELIKSGELTMDVDNRQRGMMGRDQGGWDVAWGRRMWDIEEGNVLIEATRGVQRLDRIQAYVISTWRQFIAQATLAGEPVHHTKVIITDATVHTDPAHTGSTQIFTMTNAALNISFLTADPHLKEPLLNIDIKTPNTYVGDLTSLLSQHRGMILDMDGDNIETKIKGRIPTAETLELADEIRSATQGRGFFGYEFSGFEQVPQAIEAELISQIRERNELPPEPPTIATWARFIYKRQ